MKSTLTYTKILAYLVFITAVPMSIYFKDGSVLVNLTYAAGGIIAIRQAGKFAKVGDVK